MGDFARGTTPTFGIKFSATKYPDLDLTSARNVYVTIWSNGKTLTKTGEAVEVEAKRVMVYLTQAETLEMGLEGKAQVAWTGDGGSRAQSTILDVSISDTLLNRVVE